MLKLRKDPVEPPVRPVVIVLERGRLTEPEIKKAFTGNAGALWYQALVSKIEEYRETAIENGTAGVRAGNRDVMAAGLSVHTAFTEFLGELDAYVRLQEDK